MMNLACMQTMRHPQHGEQSEHISVYLLTQLFRLQQGEQPLREKNCGRITHVSDFINEETGRLVICDASGNFVRDARKIIFPGSGHDNWWDCAQLLEQMEDAIAIDNQLHPDCQALFILVFCPTHLCHLTHCVLLI
jgi:hypothetical protein